MSVPSYNYTLKGIGAIVLFACLYLSGCGTLPVAQQEPTANEATQTTEAETISSATVEPPALIDVCQNIDGMQVSPPDGMKPGLAEDGVHDDCRTQEEWQGIYDAKAKATIDAQFATLDGELNGLVEQMQATVTADEKWNAVVYLNAAVKFACTNQDRPGAGEKASYMYNASWPNWTPKAGEHAYKVDFSDEIAQYGCRVTPVSQLFASTDVAPN